jgi:hypothetical protein
MKEDLGYALTKSPDITDSPDFQTHSSNIDSDLVKAIICILLVVAIAYGIRRRR